MKTYTTIHGRTLIMNPSSEALARLLERMMLAVEDPNISIDMMERWVYGADNPLLDHTTMPGKSLFTREMFRDPHHRIMIDLLSRKQMKLGQLDLGKVHAQFVHDVPTSAGELGISVAEVLQAIEEWQLSAFVRDGNWWIDPHSYIIFRARKELAKQKKAELSVAHPASTSNGQRHEGNLGAALESNRPT
jgi:hypothetical protein